VDAEKVISVNTTFGAEIGKNAKKYKALSGSGLAGVDEPVSEFVIVVWVAPVPA
jgi:hypothetical protein